MIRALDTASAQTLADVARATGLTRASARRFLLTLEKLGYVRQSDGRFRLTPQVLELGYSYLSSLTLPEIAGPHLAHLVDSVHESSSVSVLDGDQIVYVARVPARRIMSVAISIGTRFPAHETSMGRVLLAGLDQAQRETILRTAILEARTPKTITTREQLDQELTRVADQGYALVDQELEIGLRSIAVPILGQSQEVVAAINVSVPAASMTAAEMRRRLLGPLQQTAAAISRDLAVTPGA